MEEIEVSVIIPCLNEEKTLPACIETAKRAMENARIIGEIIVADNGSTDQSVSCALAHGARVVHAPRKGYGNAIIGGMGAARGTFLVMGDADGSYDFNDIPKFIAPLREGADFVMGTRIKGTIYPGAMPFLNRYLGTPVLTFLINLFFGCSLSDINCGMRALTKKAFERLQLRAGGMELASEMIIKACLLGLTIVEVSTSLFPDNRDRPPHLRPLRDGWRHLRFIFLFTPTWLFLIPGFSLFFGGSIILSIMLLFNLKYFGFVTMLFGQGLIFLGSQVIFLGISARGYSRLKAFFIRDGAIEQFSRYFTIEKGIALGTMLVAGGLTTCAWVGYKLLEFVSRPENIGVFNFHLTKIGIVGTTVAILGIQMIFCSFYSGLFNVEVFEQEVPDSPPSDSPPY